MGFGAWVSYYGPHDFFWGGEGAGVGKDVVLVITSHMIYFQRRVRGISIYYL